MTEKSPNEVIDLMMQEGLNSINNGMDIGNIVNQMMTTLETNVENVEIRNRRFQQEIVSYFGSKLDSTFLAEAERLTKEHFPNETFSIELKVNIKII